MSRFLDGETVAAFAGSRTFSWRALCKSVADVPRNWLRRERERQELLDYLADDFRAAKDIGIDRSDAREWAHRPFWQA
jgi:uncharacterized protein YjiS (DUF1127 family)